MKSNTPAIEDELAPAQMIAARFSSPKRGARAYCCSLAPKAFAAAPETGARDALVGPRPTATDEACPGRLEPVAVRCVSIGCDSPTALRRRRISFPPILSPPAQSRVFTGPNRQLFILGFS